jgi:Tol biopolymer transport system component
MTRRGLALALLVAGACRPIGPREGGGAGEGAQAGGAPAGPIVAVERGPRGARLVLVDEAGQRLTALTEPDGQEITLDLMPAISPDGRWVVFASTRGRGSFERWSLWAVDARGGAAPVRLTDEGGGDAVDGWPAWSPDGRSVVFASTRGGESFDLWSLRVERADDGTPRAGTLRQLTREAGSELEPAFAPAGDRIAFTWRKEDLSIIATMAPDGSDLRAFSAGPADGSPRYFPDGQSLAFSAPGPGRVDLDLWVVPAGGGERRVLVDDELGDEASPRFAREGRFVFATSVVRGEDGTAVAAMIVVADLEARPARWRGLIERLPVARVGVDVAPVTLDARVLGENPYYVPALQRLLRRPDPE